MAVYRHEYFIAGDKNYRFLEKSFRVLTDRKMQKQKRPENSRSFLALHLPMKNKPIGMGIYHYSKQVPSVKCHFRENGRNNRWARDFTIGEINTQLGF